MIIKIASSGPSSKKEDAFVSGGGGHFNVSIFVKLVSENPHTRIVFCEPSIQFRP